MIIFIDTNLIFNNWHLQNANFQYLFNFLENTGSLLAVSDIVCEEIDNKFNTEIELLKKSFQNNLKKSKSLINEELELDLNKLELNYSFKKVLKEKTDRLQFYSYSTIPNSILVNRAIKRIKPFKDDDKGYRDTLIWLSFLEYLKSTSSQKVAFINNNSTDFFDVGKLSLNDDLKKDLENLQLLNEFKVYESIKDFINEEGNFKHKHTRITILEDYIYPNERLIEEMIESYINAQSPNWFSELIKASSTVFQDIVYLSNFNFDITEGIEDPELLRWEQVEETKFFAELSFCLRIVDLSFTIPKIVYNNKKLIFDNKVYNVEIVNEDAILQSSRKIYMNISFNFDTKEGNVDDLDINTFAII